MLEELLSVGARLAGTMPLEATRLKGARTDFHSPRLHEVLLNPEL